MNLVSQHISEYLDAFISHTDDTFETIFNELQNSEKENYKPLLIYIDRILSNSQNGNETEIRAFHLHFEEHFENSVKLLIAEYLIIRLFYFHKERDNSENENENLIREIIKISN